MSALRWIGFIALAYVIVAVFLFLATDNFWLAGMPVVLVQLAVERVRKPPGWRLDRAVRSLRRQFAQRTPAIIETRTHEWAAGIPTVYLLCRTEAEEPLLGSQLDTLRSEIRGAAAAWRVPPEYLSAMRLWALSRQAVDREGGWFGFDRNVSYPESHPTSA